MKNILTQEQRNYIEQQCIKYEIKHYKINNDGTIDANQSVNLENMENVSKLPIRFNVVYGNFSCKNSKLTNLLGAPRIVTGHFMCSVNAITSLEGAPVKVGNSFYCDSNKLTSLEHGPDEVGYTYNCSENDIKNLIGAPEKISGSFIAHNNTLTSLEGAPKEVGIEFACNNNILKTLEHAPKTVGSSFHCQGNDIEIFIHCPVVKILYAYNNDLPHPLTVFLKRASDDHIRIFLKYQKEFDVWTPYFNAHGLEFNEEGFNELVADINDGLE